MKIVFMGTPSFAVSALKTLYSSDHRICSVYTRPPKKSGRGQHKNISAVHKYALENNLDIQTPKKLSEDIDLNYIKKIKADVCVVVAYGLILPKSFLNTTSFGCINVHASLLPRWRGAAPIQRSIMAGDKETGISIMRMDSGLDTGDIISQKSISITLNTKFSELEENLSKIGADELINVLDKLSTGKITERKQEEELATYAKKIEKHETKINWSNSAEIIDRQVRAFSKNPGAWTLLDGKRLKILDGEIINKTFIAGKIIDPTFIISCGLKSYRPIIVQLEGKKIMEISEFLKGVNLKVNSKLS